MIPLPFADRSWISGRCGRVAGRATYGWLIPFAMLMSGQIARAGDDAVARFFENEVRPILVERCSRCHGDEKQSSGLRIDSRRTLLAGGERGPAIVPGDATTSLMIQAIRHDGELEMPPDEQLSELEIRTLTQWVMLGAPWPEDRASPQGGRLESDRHWAFQPVREPPIPWNRDDAWGQTPIDAFVLDKLRQNGLTPSPPADRRTLIRRLSYTLTGLPPSPGDVLQFVEDSDPRAYERLVDRLLSSPQYGQQWARHWLDVARYSDTKGYVYAREERFWTHAWVYRDWVVRSLNQDLPYNRFLVLQLAADQVPDRAEGDLAAMGFLTLGRRFLGVERHIIDDRIDVVCRGTMALTVGCARCHDHKYDPIPTADYYSLYGVFDSCSERLVSLVDESTIDEAYSKELHLREQQLQETMAACRAESSARARQRVGEYLFAQTELHKYPPEGFDQIFQKSDLLPAFVRRWEAYLYERDRRRDPVFVPWHAFMSLEKESFRSDAVEVTRSLHDAAQGINPIVARAFITPPESMAEVCERYAAVFAQIDAQWKSLLAADNTNGPSLPAELADPAAEQLRRVLYGPASPCEVPDEPIVDIEGFFDTDTCNQLWKLQGEVDRWIVQSSVEAPCALTLVDRPAPVTPRIFHRGDPLRKGEQVPRQFLALLSGDGRKPFQHGSGRLELAQAIVDPANPLTARVIVNRVWMHHVGHGLVTTPSDFGLRSDPPSHPELLDWLATRLVADGWSLKRLHRAIVLSATFRQSSSGPSDPDALARAMRIDPANRLLWRMNVRRLEFEQLRDSLLAVSGQLDLKPGGKPVNLLDPPLPRRRSLYGLVDRQFLPSTFRIFDFANPDLHTAQRSDTTVPQQALFFLNHPLVLDYVRAIAQLTERETTPEARIGLLFQRVLQRNPTDSEVREALELLHAIERGNDAAPDKKSASEVSEPGDRRIEGAGRADLPGHTHGQLTAWQQLAQVLLCTNEFLFVD